ncbi:tyrosine-type recombinase/integrase [Roseomonas fluvialis]|uniref:Integrase n=1 Tax=Roseomonas fluvialis TaxID=1750527 RepID=A0ABN6P2M5_9PROT|nr:integrase family protein [Roseomonas fluvialis]BDG71988.1 integrase [Roseomonas fluvialis]
MARKLTDTFLRGMEPNTEERDTVVEGLIARKRADALSFVFAFQRHGKRHKITLGQYPGTSLAEARDKAQAHRGALQAGRMPHPADTPCRSVNDLLDRYAAHLDETAKDPAQVKAILAKHVRPSLGPYDLTSLTRRDVQGLVDRIRPLTVAGAVGRYVTAAMNYGERRGLIEHAIRNLEMPSTGEPRQRVLSDGEITALMTDWLPHGPDALARSQFGSIFALCLLTGARRSEIAELTRAEIDVANGVIHLSAQRSKGGRETEVLLSSFALRILAQVPLRGDKVFPVERPRTADAAGGTRPGRAMRGFVSGFSRAVADSQRRTKTDAWTIHDLRRTAATQMAMAGIEPHIVEAILNHAAPRLRMTYSVKPHEAKARAALEAWGTRVWGLAGWE